MASLVQRGSVVSLGSYVITQVLRLGSNLILTRLLFQEVFGLTALIQVVLIGLQLFSDVGIGPSIVQNEKGAKPEFLDTAFTVQLFRGIVLWVLSCLLAYPFALFYEEPQLVQLLPAAGFSALLAGLQSTKYWTYRRDLRLGKLAVLDVLVQAVNIGIMLVLAWIYRSVWAIVIAGLLSDVLRTVLTHTWLEGHRDRIRVHRPSLDSMIRFGRWIFFSTAVSFCVSQTDRLIFGKMASMEVLATYSIAVTLAAMPSTALWRLTGTVLLPAYSRIIEEKGSLPSEDFLRIRGPMLLASAWVLAGFIAGGAVAIELLYDDRYLDAGWMVQLLSMGAWFMVVDATIAPALLAKGQSQWVAAANVAKLIGMAVLIPLGFWLGGFPGAVAGYSATEFFRYLLSTLVIHRQGLGPIPQELRATALVVVGSFAGWLASWGTRPLLAAPWFQSIVVFSAVTAVFFPFAKPAIRRFREERRRRRAPVASAPA
jgi:O-antigen/teichoic acid export membrane protein